MYCTYDIIYYIYALYPFNINKYTLWIVNEKFLTLL